MRLCDVEPDGTSARLCSDGSACVELDGQRVCYVGGHTPHTAECVGDRACEPGTQCSPDLGLCEQVCTIGELHSPCRTSEVCTSVGGGLCRGGVWSLCSDARPCIDTLVCGGTDRDDAFVCMNLCPRGSGGAVPRLCEDTSACLDVDGASLCYLGGHTGRGGACTTSRECEPGALCAPDTSVCQRACALGDATPCAEGEVCADVAGGLCRASDS
jgi:hypothetical protein